MEIKKLGIIIAISSLLSSCVNTNHNNIKLTFKFNNIERVFENPLMCLRPDETIYFGISDDEIKKMNVQDLKMIKVEKEKYIANAKPLAVLNSNYPASDSFFSINDYNNTLGDYTDNSVVWFIIHNNPKNEDKISQIVKNIKITKCSW